MPDAKEKTAEPRLRFPEFRNAGPWEVKKIEDCFEVRSSKRVLQKDWQTEGVPFYRTRELVSLHNNEPFNSEVYISDDLFSELAKEYGVPNEGDFLVSGVGTLGIAYQVQAGDRFYFKDGNVLWFKRKVNIISSFFNYCFESSHVQKQIIGQASVSTVGTYTIQNAKKTVFACPSIEAEQQKIADCLASLDDLIRAEEGQLATLKDHKKGLMQQLFPREGETTPRLRFPEFRDAEPWEVKRLGNVANIAMGASPKSSSYNNEQVGLPLLQGNADIKDRTSCPRLFTSQITRECHIGDILLSVRAPVGMVAKSVHHACIGRGIAAIRVKGENWQEFLYQWLLWFEPHWESISQGGTFDSVNRDDIRNLSAVFPKLPEQQKIADCLSSLDGLIQAKSERIDALKQHKKGLMQQLFPQEVG